MTTLILGAGSGFGCELAKRLIAANTPVALHYYRQLGALGLQRNHGFQLVPDVVRADLATAEGINSIFGKLAGTGQEFPDTVAFCVNSFYSDDQLTPDTLSEMFTLNLTAPLVIAERSAAEWRKTHTIGHFIYVCGGSRSPGMAAYHDTKTQAIAELGKMEIWERNILVSVVAPAAPRPAKPRLACTDAMHSAVVEIILGARQPGMYAVEG